jgi:branched-chain amino acid transport system substrate-binding protein
VKRLLVCVMAVAAIAGSCATSGAADAIRVGALYPTTGPQSVGGNEELRGVQLAAEWVNAHGGIKGRRVEVVSRSTPTAESVASAMASLVNHGMSVIFGSHGSAVSAAAAAASRREPVTFFETGAVGQVDTPGAGGRSFFRLSPMGANLGRAAISFVADRLYPNRPLRYAIAHVDDPYGNAVAAGAASEVGDRKAELVGDFGYNADKFDANDMVSRLAAVHPDVLFVVAYVSDGIALRRSIVANKLPLLANIGTSSSYCMLAFGVPLGKDAVGVFASDKPDAADVKSDALQPAARAELAWVMPRYTSKFHDTMSAAALAGFSAGLAIMGHVLPAAGGTTPKQVRAAATKVHMSSGALPNGSGLDLAPSSAFDAGDNRAATSVIWEWVSPGVRSVVWPPTYATGSIVR